MTTTDLNHENILEEGQKEQKNKLSDKAKAAIATGVAGVAAGVMGKSIIDRITEETEEDPTPVAENEIETTETVVSAMTSETEIPIDANRVRLDGHQTSAESHHDNLSANNSHETVQHPYKPMASNDSINEEVTVQTPSSNDNLVAHNPESSSKEETIVDVICGPDSLEGQEYIVPAPVNETNLAENTQSSMDNFDIDIHSDIMGA